ncbi:CBS domain-containing protein [archaeon]|jgi:signal-transduction protein with cAMP-binding, CBS, and nucleotidyltransferase domain|nr:CBS domain-containing protein [archaeon]
MKAKDIMHTNFLSFNNNDELSKVVGSLIKHKKRSAVVLNEKGSFIGIVSRRKLLGRKYDATSKAHNVVIKTPIILEDLDLMHCAKLMHSTGVQTLPVENKGKLVGLVQLIDVLQELSLELDAAKQIVGSLDLIKPSPMKSVDSVGKALSIMIKEKVDHVLVFTNRELDGLLSIRDVMKVAMQQNQRVSNPGKAAGGIGSPSAVVDRNSPLNLPVDSFMSHGQLLTITRGNSLLDAMAVMHKRNIRDLIVQENGKVYGLVTLKTILGAFIHQEIQAPLQLNIRGLKKLDLHDLQEARFLALIRSEALKLQRKVGEELNFSMHLKVGKRTGAAHQYDVKLKVEGSHGILMADSNEWKLDAAIRSVFRALQLGFKKQSARKGAKQIGRTRMFRR